MFRDFCSKLLQPPVIYWVGMGMAVICDLGLIVATAFMDAGINLKKKGR